MLYTLLQSNVSQKRINMPLSISHPNTILLFYKFEIKVSQTTTKKVLFP